MKKTLLIFFFTSFAIYRSSTSYGSEYRWKRVVKRSWSTRFIKTTVSLPKDEEKTLEDKLDEAGECPISSEEFDQLPLNTIIARTPCYHFFCQQSLLDWIERTKNNSKNNIAMNKEPIQFSCPICRQIIPGEEKDLVYFKKKKKEKS
ncbi:MAG: hypothetical protein AB8G05_00090 [Oligoflexales bacterium]